MSLRVAWTTRFKKDYKLAVKRNMDIELLDDVIRTLAAELPLPAKNEDHPLSGDWKGYRECHIAPDWLLVYRVDKDILILSLQRTGSHSDIF